MRRKNRRWLLKNNNVSGQSQLPIKNQKVEVKDLVKNDLRKTVESNEKSIVISKTRAIVDKTITFRLPTFADLKRYPLWVLMVIIVVGGSMTIAIPTLASLDLAAPSSSSPSVNFSSQTFVVSRVRFDPSSTVSMTGATAVGASAVFTQVAKANFLAELGDMITIGGIRVQNLGSTNAITAVKVVTPEGIALDVRSPPGAGNELRLLGPNVFALPINAGTLASPGSAEIELRLIVLTGPLDPSTSQQFSIQLEISSLD